MLKFLKSIRAYFEWSPWEFVTTNYYYDGNYSIESKKARPARIEDVYRRYRLRDKKPQIMTVNR